MSKFISSDDVKKYVVNFSKCKFYFIICLIFEILLIGKSKIGI